MSHEVIMPALGMAQDTAVILAWHKRVGDAVHADDVLMEVETDKATMEVDAGRTGVVLQLCAAVGVEVKVGTVVAVIGELGEEEPSLPPSGADVQRSAAQPHQTSRRNKTPVAAVEETGTALRASAGRVPDAPVTLGSPEKERILSSPRAKYQAAIQHLDLRQLVQLGVPQPFHEQDLDILKAQTASRPQAQGLSCLVSSNALDELVEWVSDQTGRIDVAMAVWTRLVSGAWRESQSVADGERVIIERVHVDARANGGVQRSCTQDADLRGLAELDNAVTGQATTLVLKLLLGTRLYRWREPGVVAAPVLGVARHSSSLYLIEIEFVQHQLVFSNALALLETLCQRVEQPLRQLL